MKMKLSRNDLITNRIQTYRVLKLTDDKAFIIDVINPKMPKWISLKDLDGYEVTDYMFEERNLTAEQQSIAHKRYSLIEPLLAIIGEEQLRSTLLDRIAVYKSVSKQTIRKYLCLYLATQNINSLAPTVNKKESALTDDQKNMRWALNKYFYTPDKNTLSFAYLMMLKNRYSDDTGKLYNHYPTMRQFRYFEKTHRKQENYLISRNGLSNYQRNDRPLLGEGVQEFAPNIGTAMLDATVCDIYLVDDRSRLIGRPILVAACDANTSLCLGYALLWEGGIYSLQNLMLNIVSNKVDVCKRAGILISEDQWPSCKLPGIIVTDMGSEFKGKTFEQIAELGVTLVNLPAYRPELKGPVEKLFDLIQESYKSSLKGKGVIMPDFQERGVHDYRKDACLTLDEFERIVLSTLKKRLRTIVGLES